ncbi:hypothetical protein BU068_10635 [Staphylococcus succinus]|uniref:Mobilization protein n=1 Tax=Staphylococcus succinus TaxID=61015 RepID=A0ABX5ILR3_9STAP|nr:hypothetical protein BU062_12360 [Staphylococcus succinus]PTI67346.1 hypothetical protein BU057_10865 [Staphylococcus succinus]RIN30948.1 hypothetical protein BU068_10635 [Staphylococcus succinus]RIN38291.1 hypothetical protein BU061_07945 [Staphylococcus succinus]
MTVAKSYLRKIDTDNQTQDFKLAVDEKLNQVEKKTNELLSYYEASNQQSHQQWEAHKKLMDGRFKDNDKVIQKYNQSLNLMTKGITSMFFVVAIIALVAFICGPVGELFGVSNWYAWINDEVKTKESAWRYLLLLLYSVPYIIFAFIIWGILKAFDSLK